MSNRSSWLVSASLLGALAVVAAAAGAVVYSETAAIRIAVPPQRLEAHLAFNSGGMAGLALQHLAAQVTDSAQGTATGISAVGPKYASGQVTFTLVCPVYGTCQPRTEPAGEVVMTAKGFRYTTSSSVYLQPGAQTATVAILAMTPGAAGNTGAGNITIAINGGQYVTVINQLPVVGGSDTKVAPVIKQSDIDAMRAALTSRVTAALNTALMSQTSGMTYAVDGPPLLDFRSDHAVGSQVQTFTVTATGKLTATAFSMDATQAMLRAVLQPMVRPGYALRPDPIQADFQFVPAAKTTDLVITADAVGYAVPTVSMSSLQAALKGLSPSDARSRLRHDFPNSTVDLRMTPFALPWLPIIANHINVTVVVGPVPAA
jgi:hypothetical protein